MFGGELFPAPENPEFEASFKVCQRVMSLQDASKKMSKSDPSKLACINLIDDAEMIRAKVRRAKTDSLGRITFEPAARPEVANLLRIYAALEGIDPKKAPQVFEGHNMFEFKSKLTDKLIDKVCPIGEKAMNMCANEEDKLLEIIDDGARKANKVAEETMS